jgi:ubiquinone/menaquinone biosynthesis C-methylase UbiE
LPFAANGPTVFVVSVWGRIFAAGYDRFMAGSEKAGLRDRRQQLLEPVRGRVLEIGGGTGANLPFYGPGVDELVITEPEEPMARRLRRKVADGTRPVNVIDAPAEKLPFDDGSFDFVVATLVLCTVADPERALQEAHRVLRPGGKLLFLEHVRSDDAKVARWQDRLNGFQNRVGHGCNCNRPTLDTIASQGFSVTDVEHARFPKAPPFVRPMVVGAAERADG